MPIIKDTQCGMTAQRLRDLLDYDPCTGVFRWRTTRNQHVQEGDRAGTMDRWGRIVITVDQRHFYAHRLAWLYVHGRWPDDLIDHRNGTPSDNRIGNLRQATDAQNSLNRRGATRQSSTGVRGVDRLPGGSYRVRVKRAGRVLFTSCYQTIDEAARVAEDVRAELFGDFAGGA